MKRLLIMLFLFPLMMFTQNTTLIGDVDCNGDVNSEDASLILQFITDVIDQLPCEQNITGLTPEQLQEMINMMEEQLSINYAGSFTWSGIDILYPDGYGGEPITWDLIQDYTVPEGKTLYITNYHSDYSSSYYLAINDVNVYRGYSNWDTYGGSHQPFIINSGEVVSVNNEAGSFNGILMNSSTNIVGVTWSLAEDYTVPDGKTLYITNYHSDYSTSYYLAINDVNIYRGYSNWDTYGGSDQPFVVKSGEVVSVNNEAGSFNGYLIDEDYFYYPESESSNTIDSTENYVLLNSNQYSFTPSFDSNFSLNFQLTDDSILDSYLYKGITCNLYDNSNQLLNSTGVFNHPATATNWNFGGAILNEQSGQNVNVHIVFMSSLGMIVIDEMLNFPE